MHKPSVLVVEDNPVVQKVAVGNLKRFVDVDIHLANNGEVAVALVKKHDFALVLMDVDMPKMDGLEATRQIRELDAEKNRHTPIIAVTASENRTNCLAAGMDDFAVKPADYKRILEKWLPPSVEWLAE